MPMIEKSSASSFRIRAGIRSDFQPHDIVVHVESASDFEIAFAQFAHTHPFVEFYGFVMAIYVELHPAGSRVELFDVFDSLAEEEAPREYNTNYIISNIRFVLVLIYTNYPIIRE